MAIRTHPSYATAHENLGDVYARLASQAYDKALQLDTNNTGAQVKLAVVRDLVGGGKGAQKPTMTAAVKPSAPAPAPAIAPAPVKAATPAPAPTQVAQAPAPKPTQAPVPPVTPAPVKPTPSPAATATPAAKPSPTPAPTPAPAPVAASGDAPKEILSAVSAWASAWSTKDMAGYLGAYSSDFKTPGGVARKAWEADRRARIEGKSKIQVTVQSPQVTVSGDTATVNFRQLYDSDKLDVASRKTLIMVKKDGRWLIREERAGR
jgi:ketosteroid isomerase-like protein